MTLPSIERTSDLEKRIAAWVDANPEALAQCAQRAKDAADNARRVAQVDPEIMRKVVTI